MAGKTEATKRPGGVVVLVRRGESYSDIKPGDSARGDQGATGNGKDQMRAVVDALAGSRETLFAQLEITTVDLLLAVGERAVVESYLALLDQLCRQEISFETTKTMRSPSPTLDKEGSIALAVEVLLTTQIGSFFGMKGSRPTVTVVVHDQPHLDELVRYFAKGKEAAREIECGEFVVVIFYDDGSRDAYLFEIEDGGGTVFSHRVAELEDLAKPEEAEEPAGLADSRKPAELPE